MTGNVESRLDGDCRCVPIRMTPESKAIFPVPVFHLPTAAICRRRAHCTAATTATPSMNASARPVSSAPSYERQILLVITLMGFTNVVVSW